MQPDTTSLQLAMLLAQRAVYEFQTSTAPDDVAELIAATGVDRAKADALAWSGSADLSPTEIDALAAGFFFHRDLLASLFRPVSPEVLAAVLMEVEERHLDSPLKCEECEEYGDRIEFVIQGGCHGDHNDLIFDLLRHLRVTVNSGLEISPFDDESAEATPNIGQAPMAPPSVGNPVSDEEFDQLAHVFSLLTPASRARVIAFAYSERAEAISEKPLGNFASYARLRSDHLSEQAARVFDAIATSASGELTLHELVERLGLEDGRALGQLQRSVNRSLAALVAEGHRLEGDPLQIIRSRPQARAGESRLRLSQEALSAWRALLRSERDANSSSSRSES